ncbi:hypothetical protein D5085_10505 [Ectothiorhodospiraceae bacterium BW-2]|nr:hypothetical protein D5085_10505 [Ectothiorhodospiraceae bacterium BW-2]
MNIAPFQHCVCNRMGHSLGLCDGVNQFSENGIKVRHSTKLGEKLVAVVLDGCVFTDNQTKCDGVFILASQNSDVISLIELKGRDIEHAFEQIAYVKNHRPEYRQIKQMVIRQMSGDLNEKAFVVSSALISKSEKEKLELHYQCRITDILHSTATTPVPDIRKYIN